MSRIVVDDSLRARFAGVQDDVELCDSSGRTLGHFLPQAVYEKLVGTRPGAADGCPYTREELDAMRAATGGRTLAEIWRSLGRT